MPSQIIQGLIFFALFTTVYAVVHLPIFFQTAWAFELKGRGRRVLAAIFGLLLISPALHALTGYQAGPTAAAAYLWMALAFYLFWGCLLLIPIRLLAGRRVGRIAFFLFLALSVGLTSHGFFEARWPRVKEISLATTKLPPKMNSLRILLIGDLHLFSVEADSRLERILKVIEPMDFDLLVSVGDLIDVGLDRAEWRPLARKLARFKPRLGKYAVFGNHEYYSSHYGHQEFAGDFHREAGFVVLRQEAEVVQGVVQLVGLDDPHYGLKRNSARSLEFNLLKQMDRSKLTILLKHQPQVEQTSLGLFDLQLSGHTHGGQVWPFSLLVRLVYPRWRGLYKLEGGSLLYVTVGAGTWGPPVRVGAKPEVVLIRFQKG